MNISYDNDFTGAEFDFDTTRKSGHIAHSLETNPIGGAHLTGLTDEDKARAEAVIAEIHDRSYVDAVRTGSPESRATSNGFDWDPGIYALAVAHNAGVINAAEAAMWSGGAAGTLSSGLHHAHPGHGSGFCTFNGLAAAAHWLTSQAHRPRVTILDLDAHWGGGTFDILSGNSAVTVIDVATASATFDAYEVDDERHHTCHSDHETYLDDVQEALDLVLASTPDVVLYNAGMDPIDDLVQASQLRTRERLVAGTLSRAGIPVAWTLAGGYTYRVNMAGLVKLHRYTVSAFAEHYA